MKSMDDAFPKKMKMEKRRSESQEEGEIKASSVVSQSFSFLSSPGLYPSEKKKNKRKEGKELDARVNGSMEKEKEMLEEKIKKKKAVTVKEEERKVEKEEVVNKHEKEKKRGELRGGGSQEKNGKDNKQGGGRSSKCGKQAKEESKEGSDDGIPAVLF